ncbi:hypothetical protein OIU76_023702, partial [Salix suchowensis]
MMLLFNAAQVQISWLPVGAVSLCLKTQALIYYIMIWT